MQDSPFASPFKNLPIREYIPTVEKPSKEAAQKYPVEAERILDNIWRRHTELLPSGRFDPFWAKGRHFLLAGATGPGVGGAIEGIARRMTKEAGSVTVVSRNLSRSVEFEMARQMEERAAVQGFGNRYHALNDGLALEGPAFDKTVEALKEAGADDLIYVFGIADAVAGVLPGFPEIYVKDIDEDGVFQWKLSTLNDQAVSMTRFVMGELAVEFPRRLREAGFRVAVSCFMDYRGSLDKISRDPDSPHYGREGAYSTSLYLPKEYLQAETSAAYGTERIVIDCFVPVLANRFLGYIPGAKPQSFIYDRMMKLSNIFRRDIPEIGLNMMNAVGRAIHSESFNPYPRLDRHETPLDEWYWEVLTRLNNESGSRFFWKKWIEPDQIEQAD